MFFCLNLENWHTLSILTSFKVKHKLKFHQMQIFKINFHKRVLILDLPFLKIKGLSMAINKLDFLALSHMMLLIFTYIYYNHVLDKSLFSFMLLLIIHSNSSYCVDRISKLFSFQFDLKAFMYHLCYTMVMLLTKCISYVKNLKDFVDPNPKDPNLCTSLRVSCVGDMRPNALTNDLSKRENAFERDMDPSSPHTHTLEQGGQYQKINILTSLDPPYSPNTCLQHQSICRDDDVMHLIHDLSPHIEITKN